jgi:hypothetical protein
MKKLTLEKLKSLYSTENAFIITLNKIAYDKGKGFAKGDDGKTFWESMSKPLKTLNIINQSLHSYKFSPSSLYIKRIKFKTRKIYISNWQDKIVETFLSKSLNKALHHWYSTKSYAYRLDRIDINLCQKHIVKTIKNSKYFIKLDIKDYFYTIDQDILLEKMKEVIDENDALFNILKDRIKFEYLTEDGIKQSDLGIPFGSALACTFSNVYLTALDKEMEKLDVHYFRYADDIIITHENPEAVLSAKDIILAELSKLKLTLNTRKFQVLSFKEHEGFLKVTKIGHLGLEYTERGVIRLPIEKRRKIMNMFKRAINANKSKIKKAKTIEDKIILCTSIINDICKKRIRNAAIIDYYLKHIDDDQQLIDMDREIVEYMIGVILIKKFRQRDYKKVPYGTFREAGLVCLLHRSRLLRSNKIKLSFLSLFNSIVMERYMTTQDKKKQRIDALKLHNKTKKMNNTPVSSPDQS